MSSVFNFIRTVSLSIGDPTVTILKYANENSQELYLVFNEIKDNIEDLKIHMPPAVHAQGYIPQPTVNATHTLVSGSASGSAFDSGFQLKIKPLLSQNIVNIQVQGPQNYYDKLFDYLLYETYLQIMNDLYPQQYPPSAMEAVEAEEAEEELKKQVELEKKRALEQDQAKSEAMAKALVESWFKTLDQTGEPMGEAMQQPEIDPGEPQLPESYRAVLRF